jgi:hypothetical protein
MPFLSPKDAGVFKCCLSASWSAPTAKPVARADIESKPSFSPKTLFIFSSTPGSRGSSGQTACLDIDIDTSPRTFRHRAVYPPHFLDDSDLKVTHHHRRGHPFGRQIRELVAHFTYEGQKAARQQRNLVHVLPIHTAKHCGPLAQSTSPRAQVTTRYPRL